MASYLISGNIHKKSILLKVLAMDADWFSLGITDINFISIIAVSDLIGVLPHAHQAKANIENNVAF
ncbi:hypothetical protein ACJEBK_28905 [Peribacillus frigoritolerans]|uniref:hypothetical protein n=1 Tax=Peribacillus frigoritolerans TaxID=450367 RepID=UPI0007BEBFE9